MKSPIAIVFLALFVSDRQWLVCYGEKTLLWTQTSSIWSSIHGVRGDLLQYARSQNSVQGYRRVRSASSRHANRVGLAYDPVQDLVCWSDNALNAVYCQPSPDLLNLTSTSQRTLLGRVFAVRDIAIDWLTGNVYVANERSIWVTPTRGRGQDIYKHLIWDQLKSVHGISVDSRANKLCWTDSGRDVMECSTLLGGDRQTLLVGSQPVGITLVSDAKMIYWVERGSRQVRGCSYGSTSVSTYAKKPNGDLYGVAVSSNLVFVTDTEQLTVDVFFLNNTFITKKELDAFPHQMALVSKLENNQPPHDCITKGCQHMCLNEGDNTGLCTCKTGYWLTRDHLSCQERDLRFIYATGTAVVSSVVSFNDTNPSTVSVKRTVLVDGGKNVRSLGYHFENRMLYFGDADRRALYKGLVTSSNSQFVEHTVNVDVRGITVDWLSDNIYWTDQTLGRIMMSQISGRYHKLIIPNAGIPTGIAADSLNRLLFWNDNTDGQEKIWKTDLSGSSRMSISSSIELNNPLGVSVDPHHKRLYWVDSWQAVVSSVDYDGEKKQTLLKSHSNERYYDTVIFQDMMSWTDKDKGIQFESTLSGDKYKIDPENREPGYDVIAFDDYLQPQKDHSCQVDNGGCDQLCVLKPGGGHTCECAIGFKLNTDWKTCSSNVTKEYFILYTDPYHKQIYQTSLDDTTRSTQGVPGLGADQPVTVDFDRGKQRYFWFDKARRQFKRTSSHGVDEIWLAGEDSSPQRLVVDPVNGWLYYTDSGRSTISMMKVDGSGHEDIVTEVTKPFDIDLDFENNLLVWSTLHAIHAYDTSTKRTQVIDESLKEGGGVAVHLADQSVYYSDNKTGQIYSYNLTTKQRELIYENSELRIHALAVSDEHIYFTAYNDIGVYLIERRTGDSLTHLGELVFARVTDIKVIRDKVEPKYREGFNWIWLIIPLAALLLLLILLAAILGCRAGRRKQENRQPEAGTGFDMTSTDADVDQAYTYINQSHLFDIRGRNDAMNGAKSNGDPGSGLANGSAITQRPDLINVGSPDDNGQVNNGQVNNGQVNNGQVNNGQFGNGQIAPTGGAAPEAAAIAGAGAVTSRRAYTPEEVEAINQRYKPKKTWGRRKKTLPRDPEFVFADDKVATKIQRLANRLRNRLSSVRWSSGDRQDDGETAQPVPDRDADTDSVDPDRSKQLPKATKVNGPPIRYEMPRGFAPASHSTPQHIKGT